MPVKELERANAPRGQMVHALDDELVQACLDNDEEAWAALVSKYKNLVFSIPLRYGINREDASDIFQSVFLDVIRELPKLRQSKALAKWLIQITAHKCFHWKQQRRNLSVENDPTPVPDVAVAGNVETGFREIEEEQLLRQTVLKLSPECQELVRMLFYEEPSRPYQEVARALGLATGSIGFLRQKCLENLEKRLTAQGF